MPEHKRIKREKETVGEMVRLYCREKHGTRGGLCPECQELLAYAFKRLEHCKFAENKPTCGKCKVHCYKPDLRQKIVGVMRYAGPKMVYHHPLMAVRHLLEGRRSK